MSEGFIKSILDGTNQFYSTALKQFEWYKKILGTKVIVSRLKTADKYKDVFGSTATSTLVDDTDLDKFPYVVLINMNDMLRLYQKSTNQLQFQDNLDVIKIGDVLTFSRNGQEYKWKVINVETFSEAERVLYQYTIQGMQEVLSR